MGAGRLTREEKAKLKCEYCQGNGHLTQSCFKLHDCPDWFKTLKDDKAKLSGKVSVNSPNFTKPENMMKGTGITEGRNEMPLQGISNIIKQETTKFLSSRGGRQGPEGGDNQAHFVDYAGTPLQDYFDVVGKENFLKEKVIIPVFTLQCLQSSLFILHYSRRNHRQFHSPPPILVQLSALLRSPHPACSRRGSSVHRRTPVLVGAPQSSSSSVFLVSSVSGTCKSELTQGVTPKYSLAPLVPGLSELLGIQILVMGTYRFHDSMSRPGSTYRTTDEISGFRRVILLRESRKLALPHDLGTEKELKDAGKEIRTEVNGAISRANMEINLQGWEFFKAFIILKFLLVTFSWRVHALLLVSGKALSVFYATRLVNKYSFIDNVSLARDTFDQISIKDSYTWNSMLSAYVRNSHFDEAIKCAFEMLSSTDVRPDFYTFPSILKACKSLCDGALFHCWVLKLGFECDVFVAASLVHMYCRFGFSSRAYTIFRNMPFRDMGCWNSMISGFCQSGNHKKALAVFDEMILRGIAINAGFGYMELHNRSIRAALLSTGILDSARRFFEQLPFKDVISWNTMITGYAQSGFASEAINLYRAMKEKDNLKPNQGTCVSVLPAYAHLGDLRDGTRIHCLVLKQNLDADMYVGTCLIDLYGKCGRLSEAMLLFSEVPKETSVTWNAVISCHGLGQTSVRLFHDMLSERVNPDEVTLLSLLTACSHSGLVDEGKRYFHSMEQEYGVKPTLKHYGCMVDLFGRAGLLEEAYKFIETMPVRPDSSIWGALLGASRVHGNFEMGQKASGQLFELDRENVGYYVLLSNIYANFGRWDGVDTVRSLARDRGLWKTPGWSSVELNNELEVFYTGSRSHPQSEDIYKELASLNSKLKSLGYIPDYSFVLQDVEDDEKENILSSHSERLAIVCGILNTPPKSSIRIYKNLRVCGDCHNVMKLISKVTEREIIVRDSNRFHHFRDGFCSCGDYW
ncbi:Pentatricopeptide repeat-containing protein [Striga hermonthica]|uniref:Pentatricopeptide repeat-containing protein n=1 Tax=Striga hermonthica TaxID=68872 RepID=A0A9N7NM10_STRHE|nr:Pentatricopeptide repeat-containing protein [Striga hermonthica]